MCCPRPAFLSTFAQVFRSLWLFTKDDIFSFILPNTVFGLSCARAGSPLIIYDTTPTTVDLVQRIPAVFLFNWSNLLIFDLANQRLPESVREDELNKPWRPIPSGRMTSAQVRRWMHIAIPATLALNHFVLGVGTETALLFTGTWVYNDLGGGDDGWIFRNFLISLAFGLYNWGSVKLAASIGPSAAVAKEGVAWILLMSGVILTTMHVQDLKDQAGDRARGRRTASLVLGDSAARWTIAVPVLLWTPFLIYGCAVTWWFGALAATLGVCVACRCICMRGSKADRRTWHLWCFWTAVLYVMPLAATTPSFLLSLS